MELTQINEDSHIDSGWFVLSFAEKYFQHTPHSNANEKMNFLANLYSRKKKAVEFIGAISFIKKHFDM